MCLFVCEGSGWLGRVEVQGIWEVFVGEDILLLHAVFSCGREKGNVEEKEECLSSDNSKSSIALND